MIVNKNATFRTLLLVLLLTGLTKASTTELAVDRDFNVSSIGETLQEIVDKLDTIVQDFDRKVNIQFTTKISRNTNISSCDTYSFEMHIRVVPCTVNS